MHFAHNGTDTSGKIGKFGIILGFHLLLGIVIVNSKMTVPGTPIERLTLVDLVADPVVDEPEPEPLDQPEVLQPPVAFAPEPEVNIQEPLLPPVISITRDVPPSTDITPAVAPTIEKPPVDVAPQKGMRTAVFADARGCGMPEYPAKALQVGATGTVNLALLVGSDGKVASSRVQKSSGSRDLDRAAQEALSLCNFKPATNNGVPEQAWAQISYNWTLD